jgi:hypothetical protein
MHMFLISSPAPFPPPLYVCVHSIAQRNACLFLLLLLLLLLLLFLIAVGPCVLVVSRCASNIHRFAGSFGDDRIDIPNVQGATYYIGVYGFNDASFVITATIWQAGVAQVRVSV